MSSTFRCLWIARELPHPQNMGDRIYTARMSRALAEAGAVVHLVGHQPIEGPVTVPGDPVRWTQIPGRKRPLKIAAAASRLPVAAAIHATDEALTLIGRLLEEQWDAVVFDQLGGGFALDLVRRTRPGQRRPAWVYLSHNHERSVWNAMMANAGGSPLRKFAHWQNARKTAALERKMIEAADLVTAITDEDAHRFAADGARRTLVLTPGFHGWRAPPRRIDAATPRRVLMLGSFRWAIKQENLRQFLTIADPLFAANGVAFDVVGELPASLRSELAGSVRATTFHGFVDDVSPLFASARIAVVPEVIGGGFKLKFLDYLFGRLPVASLGDAAAGLPESVRRTMTLRPDLGALVQAILAEIDDVAALDARQQQAYTLVETMYRWEDRGRELLETLRDLRARTLAPAA